MPNLLRLLCIGIACWLFFGENTPLHAAFSVKVTVGANMRTVIDNGVGDTDHALGRISTNITKAGYSFNMNVTTDAPGVGGAGTLTNGTIAIRRQASSVLASNVATVELISTNFNLATVGQKVLVSNAISSTLLRGNATATGKSTYDSQASSLAHISGPIGTAPRLFAADATTLVATTHHNPTTISNTLTFTNLSRTNSDNLTDANVNLTTSVAAIVPVPPALALLASGLPFAGLACLRRRRMA